MSQADELINGLSDEEFALYTANPTEEQHIIVDENRIITVPSELKKIAVQYDHNIETVTFDCIRYWDGHDMSTMKVYINYTRSDKYTGCYLADNVRVDEADDSIMHFDWTISRNVTESVGPLTILVCIKMVDADGNEVNHWNSERNTDMTISQGMECGDIIVNKYPDIITYLLNMRLPVNYIESLDSGNMVNLRDLDSGTYILKGKFRPFVGSTHIYTFSSGMLLSIVKQETTSYVQIFYSKDNTIQYLEIGDSSVTRKDAKLINMESIANKVTDINEGSDDYHYPSAKAVYNAITTNNKNLIFIVNTISNNEHLSSDKTVSEIEEAYQSGKVIYASATLGGVPFILPLVQRYSSTKFIFGIVFPSSSTETCGFTVEIDGESVKWYYQVLNNIYQSKTIIDSDGYFTNKTVEGALAELAAKSLTSITSSTATNLTGLLKGNGTNVEAAVPEVDYATPEQTKVFMVTFSYNNDESIIADKSTAEIYSAYMAGKVVVGRLGNSVYQLCVMNPTSGSYMAFICCSGNYMSLLECGGDNYWLDSDYMLTTMPRSLDVLPTSGYELYRNTVYTVSAAVDTYAFKPPQDGWVHGTFTTGTAPNITFTGKIVGKLPTFEASKQYEFDVLDGAWVVQEVLTQ